jgi:aryl-alcohol dehydrogenase-like predicted oxidoreductase
MKRRDFLQRALGVAALASIGRSFAADTPAFRATDRIVLGPRKIACTRLFLGTGSNGWNHSSNQTRQMGVQGLADFLETAFDEGLTSWDSADQYGSHPHLARALEGGVPRDKVTILTKTRATTAEALHADIARFQKELGTKTIDILLLHCLVDPNWPRTMRPVMDAIDEYQEAGVIRSKGVSCHTFGALKAAAAEPWVEIDLARINPFGAVMDADPKSVLPVLREMKAAGKGVIGMKIFGAGELLDRRDACLEYVLNLDCVDAITIGLESLAQRQDLVAKISRTRRATA